MDHPHPHPHPPVPGDLVRLRLPRDPHRCRGACWLRPGVGNDLVDHGTLAILVGRIELPGPASLRAAAWEIMLPGGEIVLCYESNIEPIPPLPMA